MATKPRKKTKPLKKPRRKARKKPSRKKREKRRFIIPLSLSLLVLLTLLATCYLVFLRPWAPPAKSVDSSKQVSPRLLESPLKKRTPQETQKPTLEEPALNHQVIAHDKAWIPRPLTDSGRPKISIIIDDMGYHKGIGDRLLAMELNLTFSFLPFAPHTASQVKKARQEKREILLHLPLEASDPSWDPGPGTLYTHMNIEEMQQALNKNLASVPMAIGVNNHMGSLFTQDRQAMGTLLKLIKKRELFFLDSVTSPQSAAASLAVAMGIKTARRHVFLDNELDPGKIEGQLQTLVSLAEEHGWAVGIGHPHQATLDALKSFQSRYQNSIALVGVSEMLY